MGSGLVAFLVTLLVVALVWWVWEQIRGRLPLPDPIGWIANLVIVVVLCLVVINAIAGVFGVGYPIHRF